MKYFTKVLEALLCIVCAMTIILPMSTAIAQDIRPPAPDEVLIGPNGVVMPLESILLVRKNTDYCAIVFKLFWTGKTHKDIYAKYESYYQSDRSGDFTNNNVLLTAKQLHDPEATWSLFGHPVAFGTVDEIECGSLRLWWTGKGSVYFFARNQREGDYGIELAPTNWTGISQVNVFDPRIKWYRYDGNRKRVNVPTDKIFDYIDVEKDVTK